MNNLFRLLKISYINNFGLNAVFNKNISKEDKKKSIRNFSMLVVVVLTAVTMATLYASLIGEGLVKINAIDILPMLAAFITVFVTFLMCLFKASGSIFSFKDYDFLMSLPLKNSTILAGKLIELLSLNIGMSALIMLPSTIVYYIKADASIICFLYMIVGIIVLPLIPIVLASLIAFFISFISSRMKFSKAISTIGLIGIFVGIFIGSFKIQDILNFAIARGEGLKGVFLKVYPPSAWFSIGLIDGDILSFIKFLALSIITFILFVVMFSKSFKNINSKLSESYQKSNYKLTTLKTNSVFKALLKKEVKRYFASTYYVLNTMAIVILLVIMSVASVSAGDKILANIPMIDTKIIVLACTAMFSLIIGMGSTTPSSISIEGNNLWISKSIPVRERDIFKAKIALYLILSIPCIIVSTVIFGIGFSLSIMDILFIIICVSLYALFISTLGLYVNLLFPKFNWKQEIQAVKNTMSVTITLFASIIPIVLCAGAYILLTPNIHLFIGAIIIVEIILILVSWRVLDKKGSILFRKL